MKAVLILIVAAVISVSQGQLLCRTCSGSLYNGEDNLFNDCFDQASNSPSVTCPTNSNTYYCRSSFTFKDGLVTSISRGCQSGSFDHDTSTTGVPSPSECITTLTENTGFVEETTNCYYSCQSSNCNTVATTSYQKCNSNCSFNGYCDYLTGNCMCNTGYSGSQCQTFTNTPEYRFCVQCDGETDINCESTTTSTQCPTPMDSTSSTALNYCAASKTSVINSAGSVLNTVVTRGCTASYTHKDECFISISAEPNFSEYTEYTCTSTCDTDDCNTLTPDGLITGSETKGLYCVVCSDPTGSGICNSRTARTLCPSSSTHCLSTVSYYITDKNDLHYSEQPEYKLISVERSCASAAVTTGCTSTAISTLSLNKVTCQESCTTDGCNFGWPARPICSQCSSDLGSEVEDGYDTCISNPPIQSTCSFPYEQYCFIGDYQKSTNLIASQPGYTRAMIRGCSYRNIGTQCTTSTINGNFIQSCNYTCITDGCNQGFYNGAFKPAHGAFATIIPMFIAFFLQSFGGQ